MIIAGALVTGFQNQISQKIFGFWGNIQIQRINQDAGYENLPINIHQPFYPSLDTMKGIRNIQVYATKAGIIKTDSDIDGIVVKGIGSDFDWTFLKRFIVSGNYFHAGDSSSFNKIIISQTTSERLHLKVGDKVIVYFIQNPPVPRRFFISGIYKTGLSDYDKTFALCDIAQIQKLNHWGKDTVGGFEVFVKNVSQLDSLAVKIDNERVGQDLVARSIKKIFPAIFDWLGLQDINERVVLLLMILVGIINMTTALLILIIERTNMIGTLKSMGAGNWKIRQIFLYHAAYIICVGLFWGNVIGIGLCLIQKYFSVIKLPEDTYYVSVAPIEMNPFFILAVNAGTMLICLLVMILPTYLVARIQPVKAMQFR